MFPWYLEIVLSPDEADLVLGALDRAREVKREQGKTDLSAETSVDPAQPSRADGMVALTESYLAGNVGTGNGGERFQVMVHVDQDPLAPDGVLAGTLDDGTHVSGETLRRVACDCGIVAAGNDNKGTTLSIGRRTRSIPPAIELATVAANAMNVLGYARMQFVRHWRPSLRGGAAGPNHRMHPRSCGATAMDGLRARAPCLAVALGVMLAACGGSADRPWSRPQGFCDAGAPADATRQSDVRPVLWDASIDVWDAGGDLADAGASADLRGPEEAGSSAA